MPALTLKISAVLQFCAAIGFRRLSLADADG
eukprot:CAMPEP_0171536484 /NCGR_PEP_ID=MMETSP0959-20130129/17835_1 /TAXON_ID=87120 /ORGANISM="Aurantiochytrium limacinum, Strain ATCCMYA-1381" /LENGTH=30 /DNA_ID= /DNA_START= /DNA_END= /DNA_ORIENTATION=